MARKTVARRPHQSAGWEQVCGALLLLSASCGFASPVRNVIVCIGDGMGYGHVQAARCYYGTNLFFETLPHRGEITTSSAGGRVTDSAAAATALATGIKVNDGVLSLAIPGDGSELETVLEFSAARGKRTGLVTTTYMTHATPAGFGSHESSRDNAQQIADDYLLQTRPNVLFGGGAYGMSPSAAAAAGYAVVSNTESLTNLHAATLTHVSGQFGLTHLPYANDGVTDLPQLAQMAAVALDLLSRDPDGFFLMVEGGRIDHACHANDLRNVIGETLAFDDAVRRVVKWAGARGDTLVIVTADHETGGLSVVADNGAGRDPDVTWTTGGHTDAPVPVYAIGPFAEQVEQIADNTEIATLIRDALLAPDAPPPGSGPDPVASDPYISDPSEDAALETPGLYDGYFYAAGSFGSADSFTSLRGTLTLKVSSLAGKLSAKAVLQSGSLSFRGEAWTAAAGKDGSIHAELAARGGETLDLFVRQNRIWGTLKSGALGKEVLTLDGARNRFSERSDAAAQALLKGFLGYYTVALPVNRSLSLDTANEAPQGTGYLTITVAANGRVKIAGVLADGTKVSQASRLVLFGGDGPEACVPLFSPLYAKQGWVGGLLWLDPDTRAIVTDRELGWYTRWEKPASGPGGFSEVLDVCGGYYGTAVALAAGYLFKADTKDAVYPAGTGGVSAAEGALSEPVAVSGNRLMMAKGVRPVLSDGAYDYSGANSALAILSFAPYTGIFRGRFNLYYDYDLDGQLRHRVVNVPYAGVLTPVRGSAFTGASAGHGHCLVPDTNPALKAYRLKRSHPVSLDALTSYEMMLRRNHENGFGDR